MLRDATIKLFLPGLVCCVLLGILSIAPMATASPFGEGGDMDGTVTGR